MSKAPNAILAINSLDRYITTEITAYSEFFSRWSFSGLTHLPVIPDPVSGKLFLPTVGAFIAPGETGLPTPNRILKVGTEIDGSYYFVIEHATTAPNPTLAAIVQYVIQNNANQPIVNSLEQQYKDAQPYSNDFSITSPGALIYGYINHIVVSQIQVTYNVPTVCLGKNDTFFLATPDAGISPAVVKIVIPYGFYYPDELAATMQTLLENSGVQAFENMTVTFSTRDGFIFTNLDGIHIYFPSYEKIASIYGAEYSSDLIYKTYRLLGMTIYNSELRGPYTNQISLNYPNFLYTPYIDIYSDVLTNYQNVKDTNTSIAKPKGLMSRIYLSGTGQNQTTGSLSALGTAAFVMTADLNTPKIMKWSPDVAVPSIDFQVRDQYGDLLPGAKEGFSTEFQITLLCVEKGWYNR